MLISEIDIKYFVWTDKINMRRKDVTNNLQVDAATGCVKTSGKYFEKKSNLQFVTHSNLKLLPSAVLNCSLGYMPLFAKCDLT